MIGIRVDANSIIATGHIMRTIAIAKKLRAMGEEPIFICADEGALPYISKAGFEAEILGSDWNNLETELPAMEKLISAKSIHSLLIDSYQVTPGYMKALSALTKVTYFDEMYLKGYGCQQLINGVIEPPEYSDPGQKAFTGPDYVSLRDEFSNLPPKEVRDELETVLVTSGGSDSFHFILSFLDCFKDRMEAEGMRFIVVIGALCGDKDEILNKYGNDPSIEIHVNAGNMSELMQKADYGITAGGTTLYEVCAAGLAASSFVVGDNQAEITVSFDKKGLVAYGGDFRIEPNETLERIKAQIDAAKPYEVRRDRALKIQRIVDGKGAERIAKILI